MSPEARVALSPESAAIAQSPMAAARNARLMEALNEEFRGTPAAWVLAGAKEPSTSPSRSVRGVGGWRLRLLGRGRTPARSRAAGVEPREG